MKYDLPLTDWISIGLHRESLERALAAIRERRPLDALVAEQEKNRKYLEKVLREEVVKQFSNARRPLLEVVLNAIDARPADFTGEYRVDVRASGSYFSARDNGTGMNLDDILRLLIIPFSTQKSGIEEIGRFGVGFFSTFNYCVQQPRNASITVDTATAREASTLTFYATEGDVGGLRMRVKPRGPARQTGTTVEVRAALDHRRALTDYLASHLQDILPYRALIQVNKKPVNDSPVAWHTAPAELLHNGRTVRQQVGIRVEDLDRPRSLSIALTAQGVLVKQRETSEPGATIAFPPLVQVVEGRDEFKMDENYRQGVAGAFRALEAYICSQPRDARHTTHAANLITRILSTCGMTSLDAIPNLDALRAGLLHGKQYALTPSERDLLMPFLGRKLEETAFAASPQACSYWRRLYGDGTAALGQLAPAVLSLTPEQFRDRITADPSFHPNLHLLSRLCRKADWVSLEKDRDLYDRVKLVQAEPGPSTVLSTIDGGRGKVLYVNVAHPATQGPLDFTKVYAVVSDYCGLPLSRQLHGLKSNDQAERFIRTLTKYLTPWQK
jgi:hypothetical protein